MSELRVLVVDDEPLVRRGLAAFLSKEPDVRLVGEARHGTEAIDMIRSLDPDLVFLDVQMPEVDGFGVLEALGPNQPRSVVFVTAFDKYAIRAFDVHAVDYLLKPFEEERFHIALERARERIASNTSDLGDAWRAASKDLREPPKYADRLLVKHDGRISVVPVADVDWIEAADNYVRVHVSGKQYLVREPMKDIERRLHPEQFARVHRSAIVNLARVRELQPLFGGEYVVVLTTGAKVTLSRGYRDAFRDRLSG
ncbi:MAG: LytTR family DNA-binding domain-containing protein [Gemmatimonadota bacterium]